MVGRCSTKPTSRHHYHYRRQTMSYIFGTYVLLSLSEIGRWIHPDTVFVNSEQTSYIIVEIEESENKHSILGDDASTGECEDVSDSDSTQNLRKLNIIVL